MFLITFGIKGTAVEFLLLGFDAPAAPATPAGGFGSVGRVRLRYRRLGRRVVG